MAANIVFTLIKCIIIGLISIILTPIVTFVSYMCYKNRYKKAQEYAKNNNIDYNNLPIVNKKIVVAGIIIVLALFVGSIIADRVSDKVLENRSAEKASKAAKILNEVVDNTDNTYVAAVANDQESEVGQVAEFEMDGAKIYCGEISNGFTLDFEELEPSSKYYIIDKDGNTNIYIDIYNTSNWKKYSNDDNKKLYEYLIGKHLSSCLGKGAKFKDSFTKVEDCDAFRYEYNSKVYRMFVNTDGLLVKLAISDNGFDSYLIPDFNADLSTFKAEASEVMQN